MSTWRRHRAHRNIRASSIAPPGGEGWTIRNHRAILRSEPYASADLGAASDVTATSIQSEAAPVSPALAISPQRHRGVIAPAHGDGLCRSATSIQVGSTSWAGSPGRFSACSVALRRSRQDPICTIYPHFSAATNTRAAPLPPQPACRDAHGLHPAVVRRGAQAPPLYNALQSYKRRARRRYSPPRIVRFNRSARRRPPR